MFQQKLCIALMSPYGDARLTNDEEIRLMRKTGFEGFFSGWGGLDALKACRRTADECGMLYQSVHAPFGNARKFWHGTDEEAQASVDELTRCLEDCAEVEVPIMVAHVFIGFEDHEPNERGLANYEKLMIRARQLGVKIAFENTEGMEYLDAVMKLAEEYRDAVGFCWDTGHEMCYNYSEDMPGRYPGRLIATHISDNLGIRDYGGAITWIDDLHLLPFDGAGDWEGIARRLGMFDGPLTFELTTHSKPERHENDKYARLSPEEYLAEAYARACRLAAMVKRARDEK
ncbi:MAG: sugar phosphate isomerase/epimerase [Ruminococcaceae bacterium]|jgi:sugar phosphate isomerase/epimerase|nr:sugar phosphate isomerase/epimerase [Oscillospiraceae bacterium]